AAPNANFVLGVGPHDGPGARSAPGDTALTSRGALPGFQGQSPWLVRAYASLPLAFVENRGQTDARVRFYAQGPRYAFHLTRDGAMLSFLESTAADRGVTLGLRFVGANPRVAIDGEHLVPGE